MNKKMVTFILIILISFCFLSIVVADNAIHDANNTTHNKTIDKDNVDKNKTDDNNNTTDKNKTDDKSKKNYILAKGRGNDIKFSDGFRGFILDYSKSSASSGDEFKRVSTSKATNSNKLKLAVIEYYKHNSTGKIGKIIADFVKTGSSNTKVGKAAADSHKKVSDHEVVKINDHTEAVFDFEVLKSVSGNESDYFAYKVSFKTVSDGEKDVKQSNNLTNVTKTNQTNETNTTNATNLTQTNSNKNKTQPIDNESNATFLDDLYDYFALLANELYDAWKPIIDTLINDFLMIANVFEELTNMFEDIMAEIQSLIDGFEELLNMLESIFNELDGLFKLFAILLTAIEQLLNLFGSLLNFIAGLISSIISLLDQLLNLLGSLLNFIAGLISSIISLIGQILGSLLSLIDFILDLVNQILSLLQAIFDLLKSLGSYLINVIENGVIIITAFVIITIGAFVYNRLR